jgi:O-acetyl-ADP-ribose deacetylase (regulator of RNase III)
MESREGTSDSLTGSEPVYFPRGRGNRGTANRRGRGGGRGGNASQASCYVCGADGHLGQDCPRQTEMNAAAAAGQSSTETSLGDQPHAGKIREVYGDLMTSTDPLCHCVSACMAMGKGIAVLFHQRFGGVDDLKRQNVGVGGVAVLHRDSRHVYYLVTKPRFSDKPTYETLRSSLTAMRQHMEAHGETRLSMPELGCGLDGLTWPRVKQLILEVFHQSPALITVFHFKPARQMWTRKGVFAE